MRGASFPIVLSQNATLHNLCCNKNYIFWNLTLSLLASLLVTVAAVWGWMSVRFCRWACSDTECQVLFQNCQLATLQWGWSVVSRGDCRLDRVVGLFLRKAGGVFKMLVGKSVLSSPFLCRRTWFSNLRVEREGSWLVFLWVCWLVSFWFGFFLNSRDLNTEAIWIPAE